MQKVDKDETVFWMMGDVDTGFCAALRRCVYPMASRKSRLFVGLGRRYDILIGASAGSLSALAAVDVVIPRFEGSTAAGVAVSVKSARALTLRHVIMQMKCSAISLRFTRRASSCHTSNEVALTFVGWRENAAFAFEGGDMDWESLDAIRSRFDAVGEGGTIKSANPQDLAALARRLIRDGYRRVPLCFDGSDDRTVERVISTKDLKIAADALTDRWGKTICLVADRCDPDGPLFLCDGPCRWLIEQSPEDMGKMAPAERV